MRISKTPLLLLPLAGCWLLSASVVAQTPAAASPSAAKPELPVIGHLEKNDRLITIKSGPKGTLYLVKTKKGEIIANDVSEQELRVKHADIYEFVKTSTAKQTGSKAGVVDASVRTQPIKPLAPPKPVRPVR